MAMELSFSAQNTLISPSFRTPPLSPSSKKSCRICLYTTSKYANSVRCAGPYKDRSQPAKNKGEQIYDQSGIQTANLAPRLTKVQKLSKKEYKRFKEQQRIEEKGIPAASVVKEDPRKTHRILKVIRGKACGRKLLSPAGMDVRPMMEVVRRASFDMIQVSCGCPTSLLPGRWLDLYSGTGSVGIEAISRGCSEVHFVEMDPWVVEKVLRPNLIHTGFEEQSVIHMVRVEAFLKESEKTASKYGLFDYISVTPPYQLVDYTVLMDQLSSSPLVGKDSFILVEYPKRTVMDDFCGPLVKIADKRYGRTYLAVYGPEWSRRKRQMETASE
ncbi:uncharacterized protein LOC131036670 [Cryptomeria japonica]|uniref:uncharacterized protein LOC131036670 n=1 Tax=Cryptomeria japonica TaxID=3369 RepID=UPI0027DA4555|nr:uncharacterized protein LOC131036670 [Cryptomeria japonica]XP_057824599.2 uncharacterized protein LOC131036670 [Cryptomeria japonica]XP_057824600.2 uncharacterized protein LOC131036670 [Cryptomeria japonica]XP_057824601.2 uncharacterized protein LOC131036670 [Cryptomeria japonica]